MKKKTIIGEIGIEQQINLKQKKKKKNRNNSKN